MAFRDVLNIEVAAGNGGDGSMSFHRAKYMEKGGPDGGHGGRGGSVILRAIEGVESLERLVGRRKFKAPNGAYGEGRLRQGADGEDIFIDVPVGTTAFDEDTGKDTAFVNSVVGGNIPPSYIPACEKGFHDGLEKGALAGYPVCGVRMVLEDGASHSVDSSELAFRIAAHAAFREAFRGAQPLILEPRMAVEVLAPVEFQGAVIGALNQRKGTIEDTEVREDDFTITAEVSLNDMFGFSSQLRGLTQGKGEFSMEYKKHEPVMPNVQADMEAAYKKSLERK